MLGGWLRREHALCFSSSAGLGGGCSSVEETKESLLRRMHEWNGGAGGSSDEPRVARKGEKDASSLRLEGVVESVAGERRLFVKRRCVKRGVSERRFLKKCAFFQNRVSCGLEVC